MLIKFHSLIERFMKTRILLKVSAHMIILSMVMLFVSYSLHAMLLIEGDEIGENLQNLGIIKTNEDNQ